MGRITRDDEIYFSTEKYLSDSLIGKTSCFCLPTVYVIWSFDFFFI